MTAVLTIAALVVAFSLAAAFAYISIVLANALTLATETANFWQTNSRLLNKVIDEEKAKKKEPKPSTSTSITH